MSDRQVPSGDDWASPPPAGGFTGSPPGPGYGERWPGAAPAPARTDWTTPVDGASGAAAAGPGAGPATRPAGSADPSPRPAPAGSGAPVTAPVPLLAVGVLVPLLALPLAFLSGIAVHVLGWALAIGGSLGALGAFTVVDLRRRSSRWYVDRPGVLGGLRVAVLVVGFAVAAVFAYLIADAVARLDWWF